MNLAGPRFARSSRTARPLRLGIEGRLVLLHLLVLSVLTLLLASIQVLSLRRTVQHDLGQRALAASRLVAQLPEVVRGAAAGRQDAKLNAFVNRLRVQVGADFIVVGNRQSVRLTHPRPDRLGLPMEGGDNAAPLAGREIVSVALGSLGLSVRGKVPVFDTGGRIVGVVSTGYLMPRVHALAVQAVGSLVPWFILALALGTLGAILVARLLKRAILNLEPQQIAALVRQQRAVLAALREGVLAVNADGVIVLANARASEVLPSGLGRRVADVWPELAFAASRTGMPSHNLELRLAQLPIFVNLEPLEGGGFVATLRDRAEVLALAEELTSVRGFVEVLRAQSHEYLNRLHTINGLLQLGRPDDARHLIHAEIESDATLRDLMRDLRTPRLVALLMGKRERAHELGVDFRVEAGSNLSARWNGVVDVLVTTIGNLTENAFEALRGRGGTVTVSIGEDPDGVQVEVVDDGPGVAPEVRARLFEHGASSKGEGRGYGLALVQTRVEALGGSIAHFRRGEFTVFQVNLPLTAAEQAHAEGERP